MKQLFLNWLILPFFMVLMCVGVSAQETNEDKNRPVDLGEYLDGSRSTRRFQKAEAADGNAQFLRFAKNDGNLAEGGVVNSGLLSYHYVANAPRWGWPKGASWVAYLHSAVFYTAAEVEDANGNTVHIVSDNYRRSNSEVSPDESHFYATMPLPGYYNLDQPGAISTPLVYGISEDVGLDGIPRTSDTGENDGQLQPNEDFNGNGELDLRMQNRIGWLATSHRKETWPEYWPAGSYPGDNRAEGEQTPGVRSGFWNGEFGAYIRADQESYFVMDDRENDEFEYYPFDDPRPWPDGRRGLGMQTEARVYQWNARLAEDIVIGLYDVTNQGKELEKCIVGMYVDPDMGGSLQNDDAFFDEIDDITYAWNTLFTTSNGLPIGYFGFAFLESPGLASDGIDNDQDGLIDESQNNGLDDDGDWRAWEDLNGNGEPDNEDVNRNGVLDEGEDLNDNGILDVEPLNDDLGADGLGPEFNEYPGPDAGEADGVPTPGEPNLDFTDNDESDQVGLTSFYLRDVDNTMANDEDYWQTELPPGKFFIRSGYERDIAWTYGSGFVEFAGNERTHRYATALLYGNDFDDILRNKRTMQNIYDNDYNFAKPPNQPILTVVADNGTAHLTWDASAERSRDPIYGFDFAAYYIYRSTEPSFNELKTITDVFGNPLLFKPLAIFDRKDGLTGAHPIRLGSDLGPEFDLGISYNMGTDSGIRHHYTDSTVTNGRTYYYAVAAIDQGYDPSFFPEISNREGLLPISPTETPINIQTDPLGRPISFDPNTAVIIPTEPVAGWVAPEIDQASITQVSGRGTGKVNIEIFEPLRHLAKDGTRYLLEFNDDRSLEAFDPERFTGNLSQATLSSLNGTEKTSLFVLDDPDNPDLAEDFIVEGIKVTIENDATIVDTAASGWENSNTTLQLIDRTVTASGIGVARDYEIRVLEFGADTSNNGRVTNFQIWDVTDPEQHAQVSFTYGDRPDIGRLDVDNITILNNDADRVSLWKIQFQYPDGADSSRIIPPENGAVFRMISRKSFDRNDAFEFQVNGNRVDERKIANDLDNIYTVPDPYIAVSSLERVVLNEEEGRGERRIDFVNLPRNCSVKIFTAAGKLVRELEHAATDDNRRLPWDLRTKDGLEISHGIYFYVVEAPGIGMKRGKFAVIK